MADRIKVLFIVGWGRSGSTLLGNILAEAPGFVHVGELRSLWDHALQDDIRCGCGAPFSRCATWQAVLRQAFPDGVDADATLSALHDSHAPLSRLRTMAPGWRTQTAGRYADLIETLGRTYRAIHEQTGACVIVDSSKIPSYGHLLAVLPGVELYAVHLIRDPRGVAYSWLRRKAHRDRAGASMPRMSPARSAWQWSTQNITSEMLCRRLPGRALRLRYEDFLRDPQKSWQAVTRLAGEETPPVFADDGSVSVGTHHTIGGNPSKYDTGRVVLHPDEEWKLRMRPTDRLIVNAMTAPLLLRYGYAGR